MISDIAIFGFGTLMFIVWIVGSVFEFRKMEDKPGNYTQRTHTKPLFDYDHPMPEDAEK